MATAAAGTCSLTALAAGQVYDAELWRLLTGTVRHMSDYHLCVARPCSSPRPRLVLSSPCLRLSTLQLRVAPPHGRYWSLCSLASKGLALEPRLGR